MAINCVFVSAKKISQIKGWLYWWGKLLLKRSIFDLINLIDPCCELNASVSLKYITFSLLRNNKFIYFLARFFLFPWIWMQTWTINDVCMLNRWKSKGKFRIVRFSLLFYFRLSPALDCKVSLSHSSSFFFLLFWLSTYSTQKKGSIQIARKEGKNISFNESPSRVCMTLNSHSKTPRRWSNKK